MSEVTPAALSILMSWEHHELQDNYFHCFDNVCLKKPVGQFLSDAKFSFALFDNRTFVLSLTEKTEEEEIVHDFPLVGLEFGKEVRQKRFK